MDVCEQIERWVTSGRSLSIYPPGTSSGGGVVRDTFLAVAGWPYALRNANGTTYRSAHAEADTWQLAVSELFRQTRFFQEEIHA